MQKFAGTAAAFGFLAIGVTSFLALSTRVRSTGPSNRPRDGRLVSTATVVVFAVLTVAFLVLYPLTNRPAGGAPTFDPAGGGSDRDESLALGVGELRAGRYPYYQQTHLQNLVTQLPGGLLLAMPFAVTGNPAWQNIFWFGALIVLARWAFGRDRPAIAFLALAVFASPAVLQDFVTGGDLAVDAIALLGGLFWLVTFAPDPSIASRNKVIVAALTGVALSTRLNFLLLLPPLTAALVRRAGLTTTSTVLVVLGAAFAAVTLPFYLHDPAGFAPLYLHNKFRQFEGEVRYGTVIFPFLSLLFSALVALNPGNRAVSGWLIQSGLVLTVPVIFLIIVASMRVHGPNFMFADYAVAGLFFGVFGTMLRTFGPEPW